MRELLKLKIDADGVMVKYQQTKGKDAKLEVITLEAEDPPLPELQRARRPGGCINPRDGEEGEEDDSEREGS
jgi:hypothetical protein